MRTAPITADDPRVAAFRPGQMAPETAEAIAEHRSFYATRRILRTTAQQLIVEAKVERRMAERRTADRRAGTMEDRLAMEDRKQRDRRFEIVVHSALLPLID